jgi:pSer/pThr/pTyr-binding forkhead associated (FHA) protein
MHALRFTAGPLAGRRVEVTSALVLGRQTADLVLDDPQVSRRHASVRPAGDALEVEDHGSLNGTWVNGARVGGATRLAPGDQVRLGDTVFEVEGAAVRVAPTEVSPQPVAPPARPFDPAPQRPPRRRPGVATRRLTPTLLSFGTVVVTAIALVLYFAMR